MVKDSVVLITGGTGSFGKTMLRHVMEKDCKEVRIFSRDEEKQDAMRSELADPRVRFYIGDIRDYDSIFDATKGVDMIFHAAALKQVPSCEFFPLQAVRTNVLGSSNVLEAAIAQSVKSVVCLSTDKAVMPVNAMGMTKALMEKAALAKAHSRDAGDTTISCVRYGNVMYSRGSVIPRFIRQIKQNQPITITDPRMTRFLMPLSDSVRLVEFALTKAQQGDLFVKKAPATSIQTLAEALLNLFKSKSEIQIIGARHGEKLYETLVSAEEMSRAEDMGEFYRVPQDNRGLNYEIYFDQGSIEQAKAKDYDSDNTVQLDQKQTEDLLLALPEVQAELAQHENA